MTSQSILRLFVRRSPALRLPLIADGLHWLLAAFAIVECLRGKGRPFSILLLTLVVPAIRLVCGRHYREASRRRLHDYWRQAANYAVSGSSIPWRAVFVLAVFPTFLLNMSANRFVAGGDSWPVVPSLFSLLSDGNLELSEQMPLIPSTYVLPEAGLPYCVLARGGNLYSSYPAGMMVFAAPICAAAKLCGADFGSPLVRDRLERLAAACLGALAIGLFFLIAARLQDAKAAAAVTVILATGSTMTSTVGHALWQHGGVVFWSLLALLLEVHESGRRSAKISVIQGTCLGMMLSCRPTAGIILAAVVSWIALRDVKRGLLVAGGAIVGYLPWAILYESVYGAILGPTQSQMQGRNWGFAWENLTGVLASPMHGLLVYQPWLLLVGLTAIVRRERREDAPSGWMICCAAAISIQILLIANWKCWWGGACWGSRLLADVVPFAALLCLPAVRFLLGRRWGIVALALLACTSAFLHASVLHMKASWAPQPNLMDWTRAPFLFNRAR